ncbi:hypothetical protein SLA2020_333230 [Shorea laevis]
MASFASFASSGTLRLEPDLRKLRATSLATEKAARTSLSHPRTLTFTQLEGKSELIKSLDLQEALSRIKEGSKIDTFCYLPLLRECIHQNLLSGVQIVHGHMIKMGFHRDLFVMAFLVNAYSKCGNMENAHKVFDNLPGRNVVAWTALMKGYVHNSQPDFAIRVFQEMLEGGSYPTNITLGISLNGCSVLKSIELGKQIHAYIIKYQVQHDTSVGNSLCSLYSKCGGLDSAVKTFEKITEKNVISWTAVISACGDNGRAAKGLRLFVEMLSNGVEPNELTLTSVLSICCTLQSLGLGSQVHALSITLGHGTNEHIINSILYLYLKCGWTDEAAKLFHGMEDVGLVTWNVMISGYAELMNHVKEDLSAYHSGTEALKIFLNLNRSGTEPDPFTFSSILSVCSRLVALEQGEQIHAQTLKTGYLSDAIVGSALVNMYNKCGSIDKASKAFVEMSTRTLISWTSMISGFAHNGQIQQALQLFEDMRIAGVRPNQITVVGVLSACSHAGMLEEALSYFEMMQKDYKLKPVMDHFACLINTFVRVGKLEEAFEFVKKMEFQPNEFIWSRLLAGCRNLGDTELAIYAAKELLKLHPEDAETYQLLLTTLMSAEKWEYASIVKELVREKKLEKPTDWSWISIKDKVHSFNPDDPLHSEKSETYGFLDELLDKAKNFGYEPLENFELNDVKHDTMTFSSPVHHSEKLAVAFGLLNTSNAATVRIIKSSSMCRDSHNFMKAISSITNRKIIIRDRDSRWLHKFVDGQCSCGDYACLL